MLARSVVELAAHFVHTFVDFGLQARAHDGRPARSSGRYLRFRMHVHEDKKVGSASHDRSVLSFGLIPRGAHFDFVFAALDAGERGGGAVLRRRSEMDTAEIGGKLHESLPGKG